LYAIITFIEIAENNPKIAEITNTIKKATIYNPALLEYVLFFKSEGV
jgi:hypothetical protein